MSTEEHKTDEANKTRGGKKRTKLERKKNFKEPRMDKREKAKALDAKAKKKSASSAASKDEKKKDKVREEENGRGDGRKEESIDAIGFSSGERRRRLELRSRSLLSARAGDLDVSLLASCGCASLVQSR